MQCGLSQPTSVTKYMCALTSSKQRHGQSTAAVAAMAEQTRLDCRFANELGCSDSRSLEKSYATQPASGEYESQVRQGESRSGNYRAEARRRRRRVSYVAKPGYLTVKNTVSDATASGTQLPLSQTVH